MKITLESTTLIVNVNGVDCRIWEGQTESGIKVQALIPLIAALAADDLRQFEAELKECRPPSVEAAFPLRMIL
jgi:hypothetical protein